MAFYAKNFCKNPAKAKMEMQRRSNPNGKRENTTRLRTCFNCGDRYHFVASCPYEKREDHGGKLVLKKTLKAPYKKPFIKKNPVKNKSGEIVLITHEEYSSGNEDEEYEEEETYHGVAALATTSTPTFSPFDSPNENSPTKNVTCLMARETEVSSSSRSSPLDNDELDDEMSLDVKKELIAFDEFMNNLDGDAKLHFAWALTLTRASMRRTRGIMRGITLSSLFFTMSQVPLAIHLLPLLWNRMLSGTL